MVNLLHSVLWPSQVNSPCSQQCSLWKKAFFDGQIMTFLPWIFSWAHINQLVGENALWLFMHKLQLHWKRSMVNGCIIFQAFPFFFLTLVVNMETIHHSLHKSLGIGLCIAFLRKVNEINSLIFDGQILSQNAFRSQKKYFSTIDCWHRKNNWIKLKWNSVQVYKCFYLPFFACNTLFSVKKICGFLNQLMAIIWNFQQNHRLEAWLLFDFGLSNLLESLFFYILRMS